MLETDLMKYVLLVVLTNFRILFKSGSSNDVSRDMCVTQNIDFRHGNVRSRWFQTTFRQKHKTKLRSILLCTESKTGLDVWTTQKVT